MHKPKVSVVITTHNRSALLKKAVESVLTQTYGNYDIHIVDDCSSDETPKVVESLLAGKDNKYYWRHKKRRGLAAARNTGIARSSGEYIAFLDDDDEWKPESLSRRIEVLSELYEQERERLGVIYCGCEIHIVSESRVCFNMPKIEGNIRDNLLRRNLSTIPSSCVFSRAALERIGGFDERLCSCIDHDIWMKMADMNYQTIALSEPLVIVHEDNRPTMMGDVDNRIKAFMLFYNKWEKRVYEWYGEKRGRSFWKKYLSSKMLANTILLVQRNNIKGAWKMFCATVPYISWQNTGKIFLLLAYLILPNTIIAVLRIWKKKWKFLLLNRTGRS